MPTRETVVLERFFDETGAMHLVVHAPFGSRVNRAWGLSLRKRFCRSFNVELQAALNPSGENRIERFGWTFAPGDKVMQIENDYDKDVYNGDIGYVDRLDPEEGELVVNFDGRAVLYVFGELDTLVPAYAATIHKSQGSEYPAVVIPVLTQHYAMLQRNLLYTGITRGKQLVVLVGQRKAVAIAVKNVSGRRRWSKLDEWLVEAAAS